MLITIPEILEQFLPKKPAVGGDVSPESFLH